MKICGHATGIFYMPLYYLSNIRKAMVEIKSDISIKIGFLWYVWVLDFFKFEFNYYFVNEFRGKKGFWMVDRV
jgi:hypothetical protein